MPGQTRHALFPLVPPGVPHMLRNMKIRLRLVLGFVALLLMTALLVGLGGFGLYAAQKGLQGITQQLIPANNATVSARTRLIEGQAASATLVASIFKTEDMQSAKLAWDKAQQGLDKATHVLCV
eukprot:Opistho-2@92726